MNLVQVAAIAVPIIVGLLVVAVIGYIVYRSRYRTAKSNEALVISGSRLGKGANVYTDGEGRSMKILRGGGHLLGWTQTSTPVPLTSFQLTLKTPKIYASGGVPIVVDAVASVAVSGTLKGIAIYAEQFLGKPKEETRSEITEILGSNLRAILSKMTVEEINSDRDGFSEKVKSIAQKELDQMGFNLTSLGITDLRDADKENGYLENMGRSLVSKSRKDAEIAEAENDKDTRIHRANADKEAKEEEIKMATDTANSEKEQIIQEEENKEETGRARAKAEQSYELEKTRLSKEIQDETIKINAQKKEEELRIMQIERVQNVELELQESKVREARADAEYYEVVKQAEANAKKLEIDGEAEAKVVQDMGEAEAKVISLRGKADAESQMAMAQALAENSSLVIAEKFIEMMPKFAREVAQPMTKIDSVKIVDMGNGEGINSFSKSVTSSMVGMQEPLKALTGMDITSILENFSTKGNTHTSVIVPSDVTKENVELVPEHEEDKGFLDEYSEKDSSIGKEENENW